MMVTPGFESFWTVQTYLAELITAQLILAGLATRKVPVPVAVVSQP
jgi:hypothetical protein